MTNENKNNYLDHKPLTSEALTLLQQKGYKYLRVQGFTMDHHLEYVDPHYLMLVPMKELPTDQAKMDIYEPINSELITSWLTSNSGNDRLIVYLAGSKH
jgi:hypothetical protein